MITNPHLKKYPSTEPAQSVVVHTDIISEPLEPFFTRWRSEVMTEAMGGLVIFDGVVRNHDHGESVRGLSYSDHPSSKEVLARVVATIAKQAEGVRILAVHRVAEIPIGESALTVMVAAAHRGLAFEVCEKVADTIKAEVPIWKEQTLTSGDIEWVGIDS